MVSCNSLRCHPFTQTHAKTQRKADVLVERKLNTSPSTVEDADALKLHLVTPPVKKIDLHFPLGLEVTARNLKGVTIKDALDAMYKQYKKKVMTPFVTVPSDPIDRSVKADVPTRRLMMSLKSPTSLASSGTRRRAGLD